MRIPTGHAASFPIPHHTPPYLKRRYILCGITGYCGVGGSHPESFRHNLCGMVRMRLSKTISTSLVILTLTPSATMSIWSSQQPHERCDTNSLRRSQPFLFEMPSVSVRGLPVHVRFLTQLHYSKPFRMNVEDLGDSAQFLGVWEGSAYGRWFLDFGQICMLCMLSSGSMLCMLPSGSFNLELIAPFHPALPTSVCRCRLFLISHFRQVRTPPGLHPLA